MMSVLTIVLMALTTYSTRVAGYLLLNNAVISPRTAKVMEAAPGCVLIAVLAPSFASGKVADLAALAVTALAASRCSLLMTVVIGVACGGLFRLLLPM